MTESVNGFLNYGNSVMTATDNIITTQLPGIKTQMLSPALISPLQKLMVSYYSLTQLYSHMNSTDQVIMEKLPDEVVNDERYNTIELSSISTIIRAISDAIRTFRLTSAEKALMQENARKQQIENDAKSLSIINSQIKQICQATGLSSDNPEDVEKIQKLCLPVVRYINNNPIGQVGDYKYDLTHALKLLEDFYLKSK